MPVITPATSERNFTPNSTGSEEGNNIAGVAELGQMLMPVGADDTEGGVKVTTADADLVLSAALVAVTVTVCVDVIEAGAV